MRNLPHSPANIPNPLRNLVAGTMAWGYLWWKTRELRKQMRNYPPPGMVREEEMAENDVIRGEVIEGEVIRVVDTREDR